MTKSIFASDMDRMKAFMADIAIIALTIFIIIHVFNFNIAYWEPRDNSNGLTTYRFNFMLIGWLVVIGWLYFSLFEASYLQATPGKILFKIAVSRIDGSPISFGRSSLRYFAFLASCLFILLFKTINNSMTGCGGGISGVRTPEGRYLYFHDEVFSTQVIKKQESTSCK